MAPLGGYEINKQQITLYSDTPESPVCDTEYIVKINKDIYKLILSPFQIHRYVNFGNGCWSEFGNIITFD